MSPKPTTADTVSILDEFFVNFAHGPRRLSLSTDEGNFRVCYVGEAELRKQLAALARLYGWLAEEEVVVPGWGRIDIVLRETLASTPHLVELKLELTKPSQVRRGFQQADGYGRWWTKEKGESARSHLVAAQHAEEHVMSIGDAYPTVRFLSVSCFMGILGTWGDLDVRRARAGRQLDELNRQVEMQQLAIAVLERGAS